LHFNQKHPPREKPVEGVVVVEVVELMDPKLNPAQLTGLFLAV